MNAPHPDEDPDPIDPERLKRAIALLPGVEQQGDDQYAVWRVKKGGVIEAKYVNLELDEPCDCEDRTYRPKKVKANCKHVLAARLARMGPKDLVLVRRMGELLIAKEEVKQHSRRTVPHS